MERQGAEEFNSATYMPVTLTALLNLIDYGPEDISARASGVLDGLMRQLCLHVFKNSVNQSAGACLPRRYLSFKTVGSVRAVHDLG